MSEIIKTIAVNARRRREDLNLSQEEVAERSGLHRTYIGGIERAERNISVKALSRLAKGLNCSASFLVTPQ